MPNTVNVGLGEQAISRDPQDILVAYGLGSCLGVGMFDPIARIGGLVHAVLPEHLNGNGAAPGKFVDTGISTLIEGMIKAGADRRRLVVWMAGGANMILSPAMTNTFVIGNRNTQMAYRVFDLLKIRLAGQEVGGNIGRTMRLYVSEGRVTVRMVGQQEHEIAHVRYDKQVS